MEESQTPLGQSWSAGVLRFDFTENNDAHHRLASKWEAVSVGLILKLNLNGKASPGPAQGLLVPMISDAQLQGAAEMPGNEAGAWGSHQTLPKTCFPC